MILIRKLFYNIYYLYTSEKYPGLDHNYNNNGTEKNISLDFLPADDERWKHWADPPLELEH